MSGDKKWYYASESGGRRGPTTIGVKDVERGDLTPDTLVWTPGMADWLAAKETELFELFALVQTPPPLPHERESAPPPIPDGAPAHTGSPEARSNGGDSKSGSGNALDDLMAGYSGPYKKQGGSAASASKAKSRPVEEMDWKNRWVTYVLLTLLFLPVGVVWGLIFATHYKKQGRWVPAPAWSKWLTPVVALFIAIPILNSGLADVEQALGINMGLCDIEREVDHLTAEAMERRVPNYVMEEVATSMFRARAHIGDGDYIGACARVKEARELVRRY